MTLNLPVSQPTATSAPLPMASLREQSNSTLLTAIRSGSDPGDVMRRATAVLANYFDPDLTGETRADALAEFVTALRDRPWWAVQRAFDDWSRTMRRRPSPADIAILVDRETKPIGDEIALRSKRNAAEDAKAAERPPPTEEAKLEATRLVAGFASARRMEALRAAPMATTFAEAEVMAASRDTGFRHVPTPEQLATARASSPINREIQERYRREQEAAAAREMNRAQDPRAQEGATP